MNNYLKLLKSALHRIIFIIHAISNHFTFINSQGSMDKSSRFLHTYLWWGNACIFPKDSCQLPEQESRT